jgi:TAG lipase/steryl ester hydrolase/phospholipase A2/LPA acyltransferase
MTDLLVQPHPPPPLRFHLTKPPTRLGSKPPSCPTDSPNSNESLSARLASTLRRSGNLWQWWREANSDPSHDGSSPHDDTKHILSLRMQSAETLKQWEAAAIELDALENNNIWKEDSTTGDYNPILIEQRLRELEDARASCDIRTMMHLIRTALSRNLGGMGNVDLYRHSYIGTKKLIEEYVESTVQTINAVINQSAGDQDIEYRELLEGMLYTRQSFGRSALLLSGGGTFGMTHIGVAKVLFEAKLLPRIISGASAGSIVSAVVCTRTDEEVPDLLRSFPYGDLAVFEAVDSKDGMLDHLKRLLTEGSWSDIQHLSRVMRELTGDITFQEAYNRTRRILNICVSPESVYELPRLLNYVTAPNVMIWSAVAASCSVPLVFNSSPLLVKDPVTGEHRPWNPTPQMFIDGSVDNDLPMTRLSEMFNVNHFIVSQVNPHVAPFLSKEDYLPVDQADRSWLSRWEDLDWLYALTSLAKEEALHRLQFMAELGILPNVATKFRSILSQRYSGDITILPDIDMHDLPRLLSNPTTEFMLRSCLIGERATWPKLSRIRDQCAIELALDRAVHQLRTRVVFSQSQRDLRKLSNSACSLRAPLPAPSPISGRGAEGRVQRVGSKRHRTQSGGSLQILPIRNMLLGDMLTDEDTAEEERLEMRARRDGVTLPAVRKPRLKRASKSHVLMLAHAGCMHKHMMPLDDSSAIKTPDYDFSQPLTPPVSRGSPVVKASTSQAATDKAWPAVRCAPPCLDVTSTTDGIETSDHEATHSSDADGEEVTEESDPELFDAQERPQSPATKTHSEISEYPVEKQSGGEGLWD